MAAPDALSARVRHALGVFIGFLICACAVVALLRLLVWLAVPLWHG